MEDRLGYFYDTEKRITLLTIKKRIFFLSKNQVLITYIPFIKSTTLIFNYHYFIPLRLDYLKISALHVPGGKKSQGRK